MKILGVDPGLRCTGYAVIEANGSETRPVCHGNIKNSAQVLPSRCLVQIGDTLSAIIDQHKPDVMAVEALIYVQNRRVAFTLGQVRGVAIAAAAENGLSVYEYAPRKIKQSVTGRGAAGKTQVGRMVKALLGLRELPQQDAADALAVAICHAHSCRGVQLNPARQI
jgi:crossover junction endodeoxyribonuclease RuvC